MATTAVDRYAYMAPGEGWRTEGSAPVISTRPTTADMIHLLDSSAKIPYIPQHNLPTPPLTSPALEPLDASHPALEQVHDGSVHDLIQSIIAEKGEDEAAFFAADLSAVYSAVQMWRNSPLGDRVEIFYAIKCNPSPVVLHFLSLLGLSFDCASAAEVNQVLSLPCKPDPRRIIFANPCKAPSHIRQAASGGVEMMTFDNADELHKVKRTHPNAKLVLRILTDDSKSLCRLGLKYGAPLSTCPALLATAKQLGLNVIGVSFHVGSGCKDPAQFSDAVWRAKRVFKMAKEAGYDFSFLDIGGGFEPSTFAQMSEVVRDALDLYFPVDEGVRVIAEPGRLLVSSAFTLATSIIARRRAQIPDEPVAGPSTPKSLDIPTAEEEGEGEGADVMYYINDGVYGAFNCIMFDHQIVHPYPLSINHSAMSVRPPFPPPPNVHLPVDLSVSMGYTNSETASVWGPTCDGIDCVRQTVQLPKGLEVGDWLGWGEMGAYTLCAASTFNGFQKSEVHWTVGVDSKESREVRKVLDGFVHPKSVSR